MDVFTKEKRSEVMSRIRSKNTEIELKLRKAIRGSRLNGYKLNYPMLGTPDVVFTRYKVAIFCDGEFWHGKYYSKKKHNYNKYWTDKIKRNMERDGQVNRKLRRAGWSVIRLWESDIQKNIDVCMHRINLALRKRSSRL